MTVSDFFHKPEERALTEAQERMEQHYKRAQSLSRQWQKAGETISVLELDGTGNRMTVPASSDPAVFLDNPASTALFRPAGSPSVSPGSGGAAAAAPGGSTESVVPGLAGSLTGGMPGKPSGGTGGRIPGGAGTSAGMTVEKPGSVTSGTAAAPATGSTGRLSGTMAAPAAGSGSLSSGTAAAGAAGIPSGMSAGAPGSSSGSLSGARTGAVGSGLTGKAKRMISIGRDPRCAIRLPHVGASLHHATLIIDGSAHYLRDENSTYGTFVNGQRIRGMVQLQPYDMIQITNTTFLYNGKRLLHCTQNIGVQLVSRWVTRTVGKKGARKTLVDHVDLRIEPGEFVAIVGCSGAGKTTYLNCISGYTPPTEGRVFLNGEDLYQNYGFYKNIIAYVPQQDTVYRDLTLDRMLTYSAKLRMPGDTSDAEIARRVGEVLQMVGLENRRDVIIGSLSGGQIKRASIAVELLSDPGIIFLDEPTSGLDPGTEREFMQTMRSFADKGKTVILVTHTTQTIALCDKVVFLGNGGRLCYFGSPDQCLQFFNVDDFVDIYDMVAVESERWQAFYRQMTARSPQKQLKQLPLSKDTGQVSAFRQWRILQKRYLNLIGRDRQRLLLLLLQAPVISILLGCMVKSDALHIYDSAKSTMFVLVCAAIWIGCSNTIQEVCKERVILLREYRTNLHLTSYIFSKVSVMLGICLIQSILLVAVLYPFLDWNHVDLFAGSLVNVTITTFLATFASAMMGLLVSALNKNTDRAMGMVPLLLIPQILFSGILFKMEGVMKAISFASISRWTMKGYGTAFDFNSLPVSIQEDHPDILQILSESDLHETEKIYDFAVQSLGTAWGVLAGMSVLFMILSIVVLRSSLRVK